MSLYDYQPVFSETFLAIRIVAVKETAWSLYKNLDRFPYTSSLSYWAQMLNFASTKLNLISQTFTLRDVGITSFNKAIRKQIKFEEMVILYEISCNKFTWKRK